VTANRPDVILQELPKVSVMIPTFNQERLIGRSIESALRQDYRNMEIIVADDCSSDNTADVVKQYLADDRLVYFKNDTNLGRVANYRKTLYERVTGVWVLNMDGDDYFYSNDAISAMVAEILRRSDDSVVAVLGSHMAVIGENGHGRQPFDKYATGIFPGLDIVLNWNKVNFGHLATLYRATLARSIGYYRSNTISSDWESILRLLLHGDAIVTAKIIGVWSIHGNNATITRSIADGILDYGYIEDTYRYAMQRGFDERTLGRWFRRMIRFHTETLWVSNARISAKLRVLLPYIFRTYPFAVTALLSPKATARMALGIYPPLFSKLRAAYRRTPAR
jgi:glycosyltransferase involved in cell wall biosynthesis